MKHVLAREQAKLLSQYARSKVLLAFDFDGTLAPIVVNRQAASMRKSTRLLLEQVSQVYPCAVISGRSRSDTLRRMGSIKLSEVIGNHGLEPGNTARHMRQMTAVLPVLRRHLRGVPGVDIENKRLSISIHYRKARAKRRTAAVIRAAIAELSVPARVIFGKQLVNVLPSDAPGKGYALEKLRKKLRVERAMYVGDDLTDEDVFSSKQADLLGVRIGRPKTSAASYFLRDQREIDRLLKRLLVLRRGQLEVE